MPLSFSLVVFFMQTFFFRKVDAHMAFLSGHNILVPFNYDVIVSSIYLYFFLRYPYMH